MIIAFDACIANIGYAICNNNGVIIKSGTIYTYEPRKGEVIDVVPRCYDTINQKVFQEVLWPYMDLNTTIVIESSFCGKNPKTAKMLNKLHGMLGYAIFEAYGVVMEELTPAEWRVLISGGVKGSGASDKHDNIKLMQALGYDPQNDNESDAMGVALGYYIKSTGKDIIRRNNG